MKLVKKSNKRLLTSQMRREGRRVGTNPFLAAVALVPGRAVATRTRLYCRWDKTKQVTDFDGLLDRFWRINSGADVEAFVMRYGSLDVCERHRLPASHNPINLAALEDNDLLDPGCGAAYNFRTGVSMEPLAPWLELADRAHAVLTIATHVHRERCADEQLWRTASLDTSVDAQWIAKALLSEQRQQLAYIVNEWLELGGARLFLDWQPLSSTAEFSLPSTTTAVLAFQLAAAVSRSNYVFLCNGCGAPYAPRRKPQAGRRRYCGSCGETVASLERQRRRRARIAGAGSTSISVD
jgi:hypothetical protein